MMTTSDIPDWCLVESCGEEYEFGRVPTADEYSRALAMSPIVHAHRVKCPILLQLGLKDQRVPPSQGRELYRALIARGHEVKLFEYPESEHALCQNASLTHTFIYDMLFFCKHLGVTVEDMATSQ